MAEYRQAVARFDQMQIERAREREMERERLAPASRNTAASSQSLLKIPRPVLPTTRQTRQSAATAFHDQPDSLAPQQPQGGYLIPVPQDEPSSLESPNDGSGSTDNPKGKGRAPEVVYFTELAQHPGDQFRALGDGYYVRDDRRMGQWVVVPENSHSPEGRGGDEG